MLCLWIFNLTIKGNLSNLKIVSATILSIYSVTIKEIFSCGPGTKCLVCDIY